MGLARAILEKVTNRVCADCEREFGINSEEDPDSSHGQCRRHAMIRFTADLGGPEIAKKLLAKFGDEHFCPDLSLTRQAA